jgi:hypothetical protein
VVLQPRDAAVFAASQVELLSVFTSWRPRLDVPVKRWYPNPFTKEPVFGDSYDPNPDDPTRQPPGWAPDLSGLPHCVTKLHWTELNELFDEERNEGLLDELVADPVRLLAYERESFPLFPPLDATWDVVGILERWCAQAAESPRPRFAVFQGVLAQRRAGQRLFLVGPV